MSQQSPLIEDEVRRQLEQVEAEVTGLEQRVLERDAADRDAIASLTLEKSGHASTLAASTQVELTLEQQRARAADRRNEVEARPARLDSMGTTERLVVAGWSFVFIALTMLLIIDLTLLVLRDSLLVGLLAAALCAALGWAAAAGVRRLRRG